MGATAYQFAHALYCAGYLTQALIAYTDGHDIPDSYVKTFPFMRIVARIARDYGPLRDATFDWVAARFLRSSDIFHGWSHQCLRLLRKAKAQGSLTFMERPNSHDLTQYRLVAEEFERWGYDGHEPVRAWGLKRGLEEFETVDFITVPSPFAYDSMIEQGIDEERVFLNPYGVDVNTFTPSLSPPDVFRVLFVGQVSLRKGVPYLLRAWRTLKLPNAELQFAGRITPDAEHVVAQFRDIENIEFLGHVTDMPRLYRQASIFAFPSIEEGSALVTYEAMAAGLPLIFTYNSGSVARDGVEGIEVPIRDVDALVEAIERLFEDSDLRQTLGAAGRMRAEEYTWEAAGRRLIRIYDDAMSRRDR